MSTGLRQAINKVIDLEEQQVEETIQILRNKIPCTFETCWNWKAGQCGNRTISLTRRKPPRYCDCDIRLVHYLYPPKNKKNIKNPRYQ